MEMYSISLCPDLLCGGKEHGKGKKVIDDPF
jgi:hypothetical protein